MKELRKTKEVQGTLCNWEWEQKYQKIQQSEIKCIQQRAGQNILEPWKDLYTYLAMGFPFTYLRTCYKTLPGTGF